MVTFTFMIKIDFTHTKKQEEIDFTDKNDFLMIDC